MPETEKRILVVDDDDAIRTLLFTVLRRRGYAVDTARNGAEALERLGHCRYLILLLDLMMPRINGWQVLDFLSERPPEERPLVIVMTAGTEPRQFPADIVAGTFHKPFDVELLTDSVSACLATLSGREQLPSCPAPESHRPRKSGDSGNVN
jgi:CheY-like chemotaxis protein